MIKVERVIAKDLTAEDIRWLVISCQASYDGATAVEIAEAARDGAVGIHRLSGDVEGIFVLEPQVLKGKPGLKIIGLAGRGLLRNFCAVHDKICTTAKACGGEFVSGFVGRGALAALYKKQTSAKMVATVFVEDLT